MRGNDNRGQGEGLMVRRFLFCALLLALAARPALADSAVLQGLDKTTARITAIEAPIDSPVRYGRLTILARSCSKSPPEETPLTAAFLEIREARTGERPSLIFSGWMFAQSPALSALEHPVYDIWVVDCRKDSNSPAPRAR